MRKTVRNIFPDFSGFFRNRHILWELAKNDLRGRFASSMLGGVWAFVQPLITLLIMWFVFQVGFKNPPIENVPFIIWLSPAYLSWNFFSEALLSGTSSLMEYSYLVKKVNFRVSLIPIVKIISAAIIHCGFIGIIFILMVINHVSWSIYNLQVIYYFFCIILLLLGLCWLFSALAPFLKDVVNIVNVITQMGFWATPIFWDPANMDEWVQIILKVNPMFYICRGYRDCFIDHVWFWERGSMAITFWGFTCVSLVLGAFLFKKLRPQFADVL